MLPEEKLQNPAVAVDVAPSEAKSMQKRSRKPKPRAEGSITRHATKGYRVRLSIGTMSDGRRAQFDELVPTLAEAKAKLEEFKRRKKSPDFNGSAETVTLDAWITTFFNLWADHLRPRTKDSYRQVLKLYVPDTLKALPLARVSTGAVQGWLKDLSAQKSRRDGTLSRRTVMYCRAALRLVLQEAVRQGLLTHNVVSNTKLASSSARRDGATVEAVAHEDSKMLVLSEDEVQRFIAAAEARTAKLDGPDMSSYRDRTAPYWRLALETGLRPSEMLALRWRDVRLETSIDANGKAIKPNVTVRHSLTSAEGDGVLDPPKTKRSVRTLPLSEACVKLLRKQLVRQAMDKLGAGGAYRENDFVFATGVGTPMDINNLRKQSFLPILKAAGISHRRLYDLRHTAITLMLKANVPLVVVSERAGHASVKMTLDVYAHVLPGQQDEATNTMSALFDRLATQQLGGA